MIVYGESVLARPQDVSVLEEQWGDWWALVAVFSEVYAPHVLPYRKLAPLTYDSVDELSPADRRYLKELITALRMYVQRRLA